MTARLTVGVCGLGLIGSSVARGLAGAHDIVGVDLDEVMFTALGDIAVSRASSWEELAGCDVVLLAAPTAVNESILRLMLTSEQHARVVADLGSVKEPIDRLALTSPAFPFVATHPMAGSERAGASAGTADLFRDGAWPVIVHDDTEPVALRLVVDLILQLGGRPMPMSAPAHDRAVALVSHLPHLVSGALGATVAGSPDPDLGVTLAAGSFRDGTRVAASPPERTAEFLAHNAANVAAAARAAAGELDAVAELLDRGDEDAVAAWLGPAHRLRCWFEDRTSGELHPVGPLTDLQLRDWMVDQRDSGVQVAQAAAQPDGRLAVSVLQAGEAR